MLYNSFQFIWLFPLIFIVYYSLSLIKNDKLQHSVTNTMLLVISYLLYAQWDVLYTSVLLWVTIVTFGGALWIEREKAYGKKKYIISFSVLLSLFPLLVFKYYDFLSFQLGQILSSFNIGMEMAGLNWPIPLGISFFSFQAVGYLWDVYYKRYDVEHNFWDYMLFVCFFPQIMSGPISKAKDLLPQIKSIRHFNYNQAVNGCKWLLWGMFMKVVMADRLGIIVDTIVPNYMLMNGSDCLIGAILYSFQIYGDFAGYSFMAIGVGKIMGFELINNFKRPYLAPTITDFWKRWHISLTKWLTDYIYIPLGGSRCSKLRQYGNIICVFLVSGIWHGANWTFIFWGLIHGFIQVIEKFFRIQKCENKLIKPFRIVLTFIIVTLAWIFFRSQTIHDAFVIISKIFCDLKPIALDVPKTDIFLAVFALSTVFFKDFVNEYVPKISLLSNKYTIIRWSSYTALLIIILLCGVFDSSSFIYVSF